MSGIVKAETRYFSSSPAGGEEPSFETELDESAIVYDAKDALKYWRIPPILWEFQFYCSVSMSVYILYNEMYEDLGMAALLVAITGGMLKIARTATDKIVVEIRLDKNVNKVEITTLGMMAYNLHEFKISDMVDPPINRKYMPGQLLLTHTNGMFFYANLKHVKQENLKALYELSSGSP